MCCSSVRSAAWKTGTLNSYVGVVELLSASLEETFVGAPVRLPGWEINFPNGSESSVKSSSIQVGVVLAGAENKGIIAKR